MSFYLKCASLRVNPSQKYNPSWFLGVYEPSPPRPPPPALAIPPLEYRKMADIYEPPRPSLSTNNILKDGEMNFDYLSCCIIRTFQCRLCALDFLIAILARCLRLFLLYCSMFSPMFDRLINEIHSFCKQILGDNLKSEFLRILYLHYISVAILDSHLLFALC